MARTASDVANLILAGVIVALREDGLDEDLCAKTIFPGNQVPWDYGVESCGGMVYVALTGAVPSTSFPNYEGRPNMCGTELALGFDVGFIHPVKMPTKRNGKIYLPSDAENAAGAATSLDYMQSIYKGLLLAGEDIEDYLIGQYTPAGPSGGVAGGSWGVTAGVGE